MLSKLERFDLMDRVDELLRTNARKDILDGKEIVIPGEVSIIVYGESKEEFVKEMQRRLNSTTSVVDGEAIIEGYRFPSGARMLLVIGDKEMTVRAATAMDSYFKGMYKFDGTRAKVMSTSPSDIEVRIEQ